MRLQKKQTEGPSQEKPMLNFAARVLALVERLEASPEHVVLDFEINPPIEEESIRRVVQKIGFELDDAFVDYFRACNGLKLAWASRATLGTASNVQDQREAFDAAADLSCDLGVERVGCLQISPLETLVDGSLLGDTFGISGDGPGEYKEPILGGMDGHELRTALRELDLEYLREDGGNTYHRTALVLHPRFPDPVVLFTQDQAASLSDAHPMLARHYLEVMLACGAGMSNRRRFYRIEGYADDHALTEPNLDLLSGHEYLTSGHAGALRTMATESGVNVQDVSEKVSSLKSDQDRYKEVFDTFGVQYRTVELEQPDYIEFKVPGSVQNLIALEHACLDLGAERDLAEVSAAFREQSNIGRAFSRGNLMVDLEAPGERDPTENVLVYQLSDLPEPWFSRVRADHPAHGCLFYVAKAKSPTTSALFELNEPPMDDLDEPMALSKEISMAVGLSQTLVHSIGLERAYGFHTAPMEQVEKVLGKIRFRRLPVSMLFADIEMYRVSDPSGAPATGELERSFSRGDLPAKSRGVRREFWPGMYVLDRLPVYERFVFSQGDAKAELSSEQRPAPGQVGKLQLKK